MKRELLMLAQKYSATKQVAGFYMSEKLDGIRCFYDGGISRGVPASEVPWANCEKHDRYVDDIKATGLWTRYGQPLQAPSGWLDMLPKATMLDGELWIARGQYQTVVSICKSLSGKEWEPIKYIIFDTPPVERIFKSGNIENPNMKKEIIYSACLGFMRAQAHSREWTSTEWQQLVHRPLDFRDVQQKWESQPFANATVIHHPQIKLPVGIQASEITIETSLARVTEEGGEGVMLRRPVSWWTPERSWNLLKVKKYHDMEVTVVGYNWGRETVKGSKLLGMMGSAICQLDSGRRFELSGFTEAERKMRMIADKFEDHSGDGGTRLLEGLGRSRAGLTCEDYVEAVMFPRGTRITVRYRELTNDGIPKEAAYARVKTD